MYPHRSQAHASTGLDNIYLNHDTDCMNDTSRKTIQTYIDMTVEEYQAVKHAAIIEKTSIAGLLARVMKNYLAQNHSTLNVFSAPTKEKQD